MPKESAAVSSAEIPKFDRLVPLLLKRVWLSGLMATETASECPLRVLAREIFSDSGILFGAELGMLKFRSWHRWLQRIVAYKPLAPKLKPSLLLCQSAADLFVDSRSCEPNLRC